MRTVVILGALSICESINPGQKIPGFYASVLIVVVMLSMVADIINFIERKK
jgi:hypothetical protein